MPSSNRQHGLSIADVIDRLQEDYQRFPQAQSYDLYAPQVYFKDPMNEFRGVERYRQMIGFIQRWFRRVDMTLHDIRQQGSTTIETRWTLHFSAPLPWQPKISIPGRSELEVSPDGLIISHIDYWDLPRWRVATQLFSA